MGGAFGGKETQANHTAAWTALLAKATGRPIKVRLFRDDDQKITGKRHPFLYRYEVGFDGEGRVLALDAMLAADAGFFATAMLAPGENEDGRFRSASTRSNDRSRHRTVALVSIGTGTLGYLVMLLGK